MSLFARDEVRLHVVDYQPGWKVGCGWGVTTRKGKLSWVKILVPKSQVDRLQQEIARNAFVVVPVSPWQFRLVVDNIEDCIRIDKEGGPK